jgi:DNA-binding GntR family transcriptional regulator
MVTETEARIMGAFPEGTWLSTVEVAERLGVTPAWVYGKLMSLAKFRFLETEMTLVDKRKMRIWRKVVE